MGTDTIQANGIENIIRTTFDRAQPVEVMQAKWMRSSHNGNRTWHKIREVAYFEYDLSTIEKGGPLIYGNDVNTVCGRSWLAGTCEVTHIDVPTQVPYARVCPKCTR